MPFDPSHPLQGQKALVTGATSGIGAAIARRFAQVGASVGINYRSDPGPAEEMAQEIRREGGEALPVKADVSREGDVQTMMSEFLEAFGRIDIVVPNAGIQKDAPFAEMTIEDWRAVLDVNLTGQFLTAREAVRRFLEQGTDPSVSRAAGKVIFISSATS